MTINGPAIIGGNVGDLHLVDVVDVGVDRGFVLSRAMTVRPPRHGQNRRPTGHTVDIFTVRIHLLTNHN